MRISLIYLSTNDYRHYFMKFLILHVFHFFYYIYLYGKNGKHEKERKNRNLVIPIVLTNNFYIIFSTKTDRKFYNSIFPHFPFFLRIRVESHTYTQDKTDKTDKTEKTEKEEKEETCR